VAETKSAREKHSAVKQQPENLNLALQVGARQMKTI